MYKHILTIALSTLSICISHAQSTWMDNPFASKGTIVAPVLSSSLVDEIVIVPQPCAPAKFNVYFTFPQKGAFNTWSSDVYCGTHLDPFWGSSNGSSALAFRMPLYEYFDDNDTNGLTIACSETFRRVEAALGVMEEGCDVCSELRFFREAEAPMSHYETRIMLHGRRVVWV